jgi:hypothetical protein
MIKFLKKFRSFIRDDRGIVGEHGILASIAMFSMGILGFALLAIPGRMVLPDSPIASHPISTIHVDPVLQAVQVGQRACVLNKTDYLKEIRALEVWAHSHSDE